MKTFDVNPYLINGQHKISCSVIGAGGTGALIVTKLARLNEALIKLEHPGIYVNCIDYDIVENINVGRQLFTTNDVGYHKADVLISKINTAFGYDWNCKNRKYKSRDISSNVIFICVDNVKTRSKIIKDFYEKHPERDFRSHFYLIDCGNARDFGQVILSDYKETLKNIYHIIPDWDKQDTVEIQGEGCTYLDSLNEQDLFINDWVSLYAITILKDLLFKKRIDYQGFFFNTSECLTQKIKL